MKAPELKPCPFCGSSEVFISQDDWGLPRWVTCANCDADGPLISDLKALEASTTRWQDVADKWNTRAPQ